MVKVSQTDRAIIFKVVSQVSVLRYEVNAFDVFKFVFRVYLDVRHFFRHRDHWWFLKGN
jgi:hypothetical protein